MPSCPKSLFYEFMDFTYTVAQSFNVLPFEILKQDKDEVIMLINYFNEKGETAETKAETKHENKPKSQQRIRVNDKTATGGWF